MRWLPVFTCGHPRVPENWVKCGSTPRQNLRCKTCRQLKRVGLPAPVKVVFHCGHPNSEENRMPSMTRGVMRYRCKCCEYERQGIFKPIPLVDPAAVAIGILFIRQHLTINMEV